MNKRILFIAGIAVGAVVLALGLFFIVRALLPDAPQEVSMYEPTDVVRDFYKPWLDALLSTTTDPYREGLADAPILSKELRAHIKKEGRAKDALDPVFCQPVIPPDFSTRTVFETPEKAELLVMSRPSGPPEQAIVSLTALNGGWYIENIRCSPGEFAPEREFSFDNEGFLMKNVPAPLNPELWHLIFTESEELGHYAPLIFTPESMCTLDGKATVCDPSTFRELQEVHVQGEMTELGVEVKKVGSKK